MRPFARPRQIAAIAAAAGVFAGFMSPEALGAAPCTIAAVQRAGDSGATLQNVYYYRGRHYKYHHRGRYYNHRYRGNYYAYRHSGMYFNHRYYGGGRWHYY